MSLSNDIEKYLIEKARSKRQCIKAQIELLPTCNLDCKMCYVRSSMKDVLALGGLKSKDEWLALAKEMKEAGVLFLLLTGGEVFTYPFFKELYIELYKMGFMITINSNATLIDEEAVEWLKLYPPKIISISLYGASDETYESLCKVKGMFTKVNHAIELLMDANITIELKTIVTPLNEHDLNNCIEYAKKRGLYHEHSYYSYPAVRKIRKEDQIRFSSEEMFDRLIQNKDYEIEDALSFIEKIHNTKHKENCEHYGIGCSGTNFACWINWQGRMIACAMIDCIYTLPFEVGFKQAFEYLKYKYDHTKFSSKCANCDLRAVCIACPASNYCESGKIDGTSDFHCDLTNRLVAYYHNVLEEHK